MKTLLFVLLTSLAACAPEQVQYARLETNVDFRAFKTYNFMDVSSPSGTVAQGPGVDALKQAIRRELNSRGYQQGDNPDLLVNIGVMVQDKVQTRETTIREAPRYIGQRNYHWQSQEVVVGRYEEGTATVEIVDAAHREVVWQGAVKSILTSNPTKLTKRIDDAIAALFVKYPVPAQ
jgi:hypothetical protein